MGIVELAAMLTRKKSRKVSEYRMFISSVNLARFVGKEKDKPVYVYVRDGKLRISKSYINGSVKRRFLVHYAHGKAINVEIYLFSKIANQIKKFNERDGRSKRYAINKWWDIQVVLIGFPETATRKYSRLESVRKVQKASVPVLRRKYGGVVGI